MNAPDLVALQSRLKEALAERDAALLALARERELTNALRIQTGSALEPEVPRYPASSGLGPPPLRYLLADRANEQLKSVFGPLERPARRLAQLLLRDRR